MNSHRLALSTPVLRTKLIIGVFMPRSAVFGRSQPDDKEAKKMSGLIQRLPITLDPDRQGDDRKERDLPEL